MQVQSEKPYDTINVTPMLDLAYVLLVVFILMTTASVQGLSVSMPKPSNKPSTEQHDIRIVQVLPDGSLLINGVGVSLVELESTLNQGKAADPKMTVAIKGDARAHYAKVVSVIDLCNKLEVNMALVTTRIGT
ncbi:MAG TPA: biopolymer transporter ExbD [Aquabacterium sp.]|uniref:ExbD/TolR family protein n=1 Tax=Aquabacterium sp. TaxID=1872578 RepID=UPI002D973DA9|nr:biopolymer transporter ExbD [Aquabacterium sp.]HET6786491.1 biopolymer transporter ExbD [Aquabacterium sp.]HEX5373989.1 biopolymer transporter ExbD [Aquabacterium sp.]